MKGFGLGWEDLGLGLMGEERCEAASEGRFSNTCSARSLRAGAARHCHATAVRSCERLRYPSEKGLKSA